MKNYKMNWEAVEDKDPRHTARTMYIAEGFRIWKGKRWLWNNLYSADEWHLIRVSDNVQLHAGKTAKECKEVMEFEVNLGTDINTVDSFGISYGAKFNEDCTWFQY